MAITLSLTASGTSLPDLSPGAGRAVQPLRLTNWSSGSKSDLYAASRQR